MISYSRKILGLALLLPPLPPHPSPFPLGLTRKNPRHATPVFRRGACRKTEGGDRWPIGVHEGAPLSLSPSSDPSPSPSPYFFYIVLDG